MLEVFQDLNNPVSALAAGCGTAGQPAEIFKSQGLAFLDKLLNLDICHALAFADDFRDLCILWFGKYVFLMIVIDCGSECLVSEQ